MELEADETNFAACSDWMLGTTRSMVSMREFLEQKKDYECSLGHLAEGSLEYTESAAACHQRGADRCLKIARLHGGVYIKAAQLIASIRIGSHDHGIPWQYVKTLSVLTDQAPHKTISEVADVLKEGLSLGSWPATNLDETCDLLSIEAEPVASASLAQVHRAVLRDGTVAAVKVQYPELQREMASDFQALKSMGDEVKEMSTGFDLMWIVEDLEKQLLLELDFELECRNTKLLRSRLAHLSPHVYIPRPFPELCSRRVLTMEFCEGLLRLDDPAALCAAGLDVQECASLVCDTFAEMVFVHGHMHADPHSGNIYVRALISDGRKKPQPQLVILDHGLHHDLEASGVRRAFCRLWKACCARDCSTVETCGRDLVGHKLFRMLPVMLSPWFVLSTPSVSWSDLEAAADGRLPDTIVLADVVEFLAAARAGNGNVVGLLHSLGYVRGLLSGLEFSEGRRLASMLRFAMIGDCPAPMADGYQDLTFGQRAWLRGSVGWMECQLSAAAPFAKLLPRCCGRTICPDHADGHDLYGITPVQEAGSCDMERERLQPSSLRAATSTQPAHIGAADNPTSRALPKVTPQSECTSTAEPTSEIANKVGKAPPTKEVEKKEEQTKNKMAVGKTDATGSQSKIKITRRAVATATLKNDKADNTQTKPVQKTAKAARQNEEKEPPNLTKEQARKALRQAVQLLEQPKNKKRLVSAVKKAKASSDDPLGQQLAVMETVLPLGQEILGELLDQYGFPRERLMLAVLQIQKHAKGDERMQKEVARLTGFLQNGTS